jgi:hypothetical protein
MLVQHKITKELGYSDDVNPIRSDQVLVVWSNQNIQSVATRDLSVYLNKLHSWKDMDKAFKDRNLIMDADGFQFYEKR